jgi:hypothetical protein
MIGFKSHWFGKEVEGRYSDIDTMFIADFKDISVNNVKVPHIYICSPATAQLIEGTVANWEHVFKLLDTFLITIEATPGMVSKIPPMIRIRTHVMLMINCEDAELLKNTDSIKVVYGDYKLYCTTVHNMQHVRPDDYKFDTK